MPRVVRMPTSPQKNRWTALELARLRKALCGNTSQEDMGVLFPNRTPEAVRKKIYRLSKTEVTVERQEAWRETVVVEKTMSVPELRAQGLTIDEIASVMGNSRVEVYEVLRADEH